MTLKGVGKLRIPLADGAGAMPAIGFGTLIPDPVATTNATQLALRAGFRHFDCAERYCNEAAVGKALHAALAAGTVRREELFITTKLWNNHHRPEYVRPAFEASVRDLQVGYADCYLIHTPFAFQPGDDQDPRDAAGAVIYDPGVTLLDTWRALEALVDAGRCRAIGVSDIGLDALRTLYDAARIKPAVLQVEAHPYLPQWELLDFCRDHDIVFLAFAPLGHGRGSRLLEDPVLAGIAGRLGCTPAQLALAWAVQRGTAFLATSTDPRHLADDFAVPVLPGAAMREIRDRITTRVRLNTVVRAGVPGFIPRDSP